MNNEVLKDHTYLPKSENFLVVLHKRFLFLSLLFSLIEEGGEKSDVTYSLHQSELNNICRSGVLGVKPFIVG